MVSEASCNFCMAITICSSLVTFGDLISTTSQIVFSTHLIFCLFTLCTLKTLELILNRVSNCFNLHHIDQNRIVIWVTVYRKISSQTYPNQRKSITVWTTMSWWQTRSYLMQNTNEYRKKSITSLSRSKNSVQVCKLRTI